MSPDHPPLTTATAAIKPLLVPLLERCPQRPVPVWLMRQAGRYLPEYRALRARARHFLDLCYHPAHAAEVTLQPVRRFGMDAAIIFSDILVIPDALGVVVAFREAGGPVLVAPTDWEHGLRTMEERLHQGTMARHLAPVYEAIRIVVSQLPPAVACIGFAGAPWTLAAYMLEGDHSAQGTDGPAMSPSPKDYARARIWAYQSPERFARLITMLTAAVVEHLSAQITAGCEVVQLFDSWAGVLPAEAFRDWVIEPARAVVTALRQRHPDVPIIGFPRGAGMLLPAYVEATGVDGVSLDTSMPLELVHRLVAPHVVLQGNFDPAMLTASPACWQHRVEEMVALMATRPFIFNLGHGVLPTTPPEHVQALVARVRKVSG